MSVAATTSQKQSCRPPGAMSHARAHAMANVTSVKTHASRMDRRPLGSGRRGLFTASISKS